MAAKKKTVVSEFVDAFVTLSPDHRATSSPRLRLYVQVMKPKIGASTFTRDDVDRMFVFDDASPLEAEKASYFASMLEKFVLVTPEQFNG